MLLEEPIQALVGRAETKGKHTLPSTEIMPSPSCGLGARIQFFMCVLKSYISSKLAHIERQLAETDVVSRDISSQLGPQRIPVNIGTVTL